MKMIPKLRRNYYLRTVGIFLITVALTVGTVSCGGGAVKYSLTMAANPVAGGNATDLTGASPYAAGTVVNIQAVAASGYKFVNWTAPAGGFTNAAAATTTFTMPAQDVTVTANFVMVYDLTMAANPVAGGNATDLTGASPYAVGTIVNIQAAATPPYQFVSWTALAGTFANENSSNTTFTMPAQDVIVTANFVGPIDHFTYYQVDSEWYVGENVTLEDQFGAFNAMVGYAYAFGNPAQKEHSENVTPIWNPDHHFTVYYISYEEEHVVRSVEVKNQFGTQELTVNGPVALAVPTQKVEPGNHKQPFGLDHYLLYEVIGGTSVEQVVDLNDEFGPESEIHVYEPVLFANPVRKTHGEEVTEIQNPDMHAVIYSIYGGYFDKTVQVGNQFGEQALNVSGPYYLAVPSEKIAPPPLDHFKCYVVDAPPLEDVYVYLQDQFYSSDVQVNYAELFCNPVEKVHGENMTSIVNPDNHLTVYNITAPQTWWYVEVDNQFGRQPLIVCGPVALAAPTHKLDPGSHGPPMYLDHYLLYQVVAAADPDVDVSLDDEFPYFAEWVNVATPVYFANPVLYKYNYSSGDETGAWDPEAHLVFYMISDNSEWYPEVTVANQFEEQTLELAPPTGQLLAVPSEKVCYEGPV